MCYSALMNQSPDMPLPYAEVLGTTWNVEWWTMLLWVAALRTVWRTFANEFVAGHGGPYPDSNE